MAKSSVFFWSLSCPYLRSETSGIGTFAGFFCNLHLFTLTISRFFLQTVICRQTTLNYRTKASATSNLHMPLGKTIEIFLSYITWRLMSVFCFNLRSLTQIEPNIASKWQTDSFFKTIWLFRRWDFVWPSFSFATMAAKLSPNPTFVLWKQNA